MSYTNDNSAGPSCPNNQNMEVKTEPLTDDEIEEYFNMSYTDDNSGEPSPQKGQNMQIKTDSLTENEILGLFAVLSDENQFKFKYDSDEDLYNPEDTSDDSNSEGEYEEYVVRNTKCHVPDINWGNDPISMELFSFTKSECLLHPTTRINPRPIDYFNHLFTEEMLAEILSHTNDYAHHVLFDQTTNKSSRIPKWKDATKEEMLVFIGLILHMGTIRLTRIKDYWKTDELFGLRVFADNMTRDRFFLLLSALHFARVPEQDSELPKDRMYKIRGLVNLFNVRMAEIYYPGREIGLSESVCFKEYILNKLNKRDIKFYMITAPDGMVIKCMVDDCKYRKQVHRLMLNLLDGMLDAGHSVFLNNYYNSYELVKHLAERKTHCTGTIRKKEKIFPTEVRETKLKKGETIAKFANGVMIAKWKDARDVTYISNEYMNDIIEISNKRGDKKIKPLPIIQYNKFMTGTKKLDQMILAYYPCERQKIRWPTKVFIHILQLIISNAYLLYNKNSDENMPLYDFRLSVIRSLLKPEPGLRIPLCNSSKSKHVLNRYEEKNGRKMRKHCKSCYSKGRGGKRRFTVYVCNTCAGRPGYCLDCATIIHP